MACEIVKMCESEKRKYNFGIFFSILAVTVMICGSFTLKKWGFTAHKQINRLAVFTLPPEMLGFYKANLKYLTENAVNPDRRRYAVDGEAPRHFIDVDVYGEDAVHKLPHRWDDAVKQVGEDSLMKHGIVPWVLPLVKSQLTTAFKNKDVLRILKLSADLGHYAGDINVPLHTTRNYNGQLTGQEGIHGFWETRIPEKYAAEYDFFVGKAEYLESIPKAAWKAVTAAHAATDSVLLFEKTLTAKMGESRKYSIEDRLNSVQRTYSTPFTEKYNEMLNGQVERQMRASIKLTADLWFTAWVDAGQPDLSKFGAYQLTENEQKADEDEKKSWLKKLFTARQESDN